MLSYPRGMSTPRDQDQGNPESAERSRRLGGLPGEGPHLGSSARLGMGRFGRGSSSNSTPRVQPPGWVISSRALRRSIKSSRNRGTKRCSSSRVAKVTLSTSDQAHYWPRTAATSSLSREVRLRQSLATILASPRTSTVVSFGELGASLGMDFETSGSKAVRFLAKPGALTTPGTRSQSIC